MINWNRILELTNLGNLAPDYRIEKTDEDWRAVLSNEEYRVTRQKGTEPAFSSEMCSLFEAGLYRCTCCNTMLFDAHEKFESGTGWPSFTQPIKNNVIAYYQDNSHGMNRIEVTCNCCDAHLGHVFPDGPAPSGLRYCINAVAVRQAKGVLEVATFGGGCFWCTEAIFNRLAGVESVRSGYAGGQKKNPCYREVCNGSTGHAEVVQVQFDSSVINYYDIIRIHLTTHNPTTLNAQGADHGTQYRSIVLVHDRMQQAVTERVLEEAQDAFDNPIVTEVVKFEHFYEAESEHQNFYNRQPKYGYCQTVIEPKLAKFKALYTNKLKHE